MQRETAAPISAPFEAGECDWQARSVLIVDDDEPTRRVLESALRSRFGMVEAAPDVDHAARLTARLHFDLLILDVPLPGPSGFEGLRTLREQGFAGDVILITARADLDTAIHALRVGASDFILKPFGVEQIVHAIGNCVERAHLARESFALRRELAQPNADDKGLVGHSQSMQQLRMLLRRVAQTPSTVLLLGESGTGKEVAARALHEMSPRAQRPFVPVNCAAIASELIESELFGHVRGAFTGAIDSRNGLFHYADGGTLFLDEIGELPLPLQTRLLRVLEERRLRPVGSERELPIDVRVVAASNRDLAADVAAGRFREDLYFRLAVVDIPIPPLRERAEDVPELVRHFMDLLTEQLGVPPLMLPHALATRLVTYAWPGNVRELRNFVERSLILGAFPSDVPSVRTDALSGSVDLPLGEVQKRHILRTLAACGGNKSEAARRLGISRKTLERKCADWND
jgi:DNA-binding NtrC family response regulator